MLVNKSMNSLYFRGKQFVVIPLSILLIGSFLSSCSDPSKSTITRVISEHITNAPDETWCLNTDKIKTYNDDTPLSIQALVDAASSRENGASFNAENIFPLIFSEEAFVQWSDQDVFIMELLIGGGYINVHSGGYAQSSNAPGQPGNIYEPRNADQVDAIIETIREKGAVVDLSTRGESGGVWSPSEGGFCVQGAWVLNEISGWTSPSTDQNGQIVTHVTASERFVVSSIGTEKYLLNPMNFQYITADIDYDVVKFNDGWHVTSQGNSD